MISALSRGFPILAVAEKQADIPSLLRISADLSLETGKLDRRFVADLVEVLYPGTAIETLGLPLDCDARWLSLEDLVLAFRPGRHIRDVLHVLATLIDRNRGDFEEEGGDEGGRQRIRIGIAQYLPRETPGIGQEAVRHRKQRPLEEGQAIGRRGDPAGTFADHPMSPAASRP
ncbi:hypothetical protein J2Y48_003444 [Mycoplana sp. BE70]|uniref:hypothetical protein n=1 Tax=Mycoplana sp. BE70 TaxID=2817775 RepID=UPI00285E4746|nr:hypothetical protein [Mycoplana sp. BE70]MDR6758146.1 hypothetical protein [Mycoplana sp. BE70]